MLNQESITTLIKNENFTDLMKQLALLSKDEQKKLLTPVDTYMNLLQESTAYVSNYGGVDYINFVKLLNSLE